MILPSTQEPSRTGLYNQLDPHGRTICFESINFTGQPSGSLNGQRYVTAVYSRPSSSLGSNSRLRFALDHKLGWASITEVGETTFLIERLPTSEAILRKSKTAPVESYRETTISAFALTDRVVCMLVVTWKILIIERDAVTAEGHTES